MRWKWIIYFITCSTATVLGGAVILMLVGLASFLSPPLYNWFASLTLAPMGSGYVLALTVGVSSCLVIGTFISIWLGLSFTSQISDHLRSVAWGAESLARGDLSFRLPDSEDKELQAISDSFNMMAGRIESQVMVLQRMAEENTELMEQASETAALNERNRLASELHDAVAQLLFAMNMSTAAAIRILPKNQEKALQQMEYVQDMAIRAQAEMRALLLHLRPVSLGDRSFKKATEELLHEVHQKAGLVMEITLADIPMSKAVEDNLFRIMQEAVANSMKHSEASVIKVSLSRNSRRLLLTVEDDGVGMPKDPQKQTSYGLRNMEERAQKIGGSVTWLSLSGKGTRVEVRVPLAKEDDDGGVTA